MIHCLWLPLFSQGMGGNDQAECQVWLLPTVGSGEGQQKFQGTPMSVSACLCLLAACEGRSVSKKRDSGDAQLAYSNSQ